MLRKSRVLALSVSWSLVLASLLVACGPAAAPTPTSVPKPAATASPAPKPAAPAAPTAAPKPALAAPTAAAPATQAAGPSEWIVGLSEEITTPDPATSSVRATDILAQHLFSPLVNFESAPGGTAKPGPMVAESWSRLDDATWLFKLRKGIKFHNGDELTASDVKYSLDVYNRDKSVRKSYLSEVAKVEEVDPYTIKISTLGPNATLFIQLTYLPILPRQAREKMGEEAFGRSPIGTGPYKFVEFVRGQKLVLEASPSFWRGPVQPTRLTIRPLLDPSTRVAELKSGGVHLIDAPPVARLKELQGGDTEVLTLKGNRVITYPFNTKEKPFDDVRVRQAVNYAVDRDSIIKNVLEGYGEVLHGPYSPGWQGYDPDLKPYPYDPAKAKQLLAEAGYPNGLETQWSITSGAALKDREIAEAVANQLARVGIKVQLVPTERGKIQSDWTSGVFKGMTSTGSSLAADSDAMIAWSLYKRPGHKPDEKLTSLIEQSRRSFDPDQRTKLLQELGRYVHDQAYWMFIHAQSDFYAKRKEIPWQPLKGATGSYGAMRYFVW